MIYADSAEPQRIKMIREVYGKTSNKRKNGIDFIKTFKIHIKTISELQKEIRSYSWKTDRDGRVLDEPVKIGDHLLDSTRYAVYTYLKKPAPSITWVG